MQVIGQQWNWTYRFPGYGAVETAHLELPVDSEVEFHVTSLDVTHSFWAYELGVKADAVPGVDNIAFVHTRKLGTFSIRCAELCGLWHGHMFQTGEVVTPARFGSLDLGGAESGSVEPAVPAALQRPVLPRADSGGPASGCRDRTSGPRRPASPGLRSASTC